MWILGLKGINSLLFMLLRGRGNSKNSPINSISLNLFRKVHCLNCKVTLSLSSSDLNTGVNY